MVVIDNGTSTVVSLMVPVVLGWIPLAIGAISAISSMLSKGAKGSADARQQEALTNSRIYDSQVNGEAERQKFALQAPGQRVNEIARGSLIGNMGDFKMAGPAGAGVTGPDRANAFQTTGGLRPSALNDPRLLEARDLMIAQHLAGLKKGDLYALPQAPKQTKAGWLEKIMGGVGMAGSILGGLQGAGVLGNGGGGVPMPNLPEVKEGLPDFLQSAPWGKYTFNNFGGGE